MGLDMNLSKINKKVDSMEEFEDCIGVANENRRKMDLIERLDDFSKLSLIDFLDKHYLIHLLRSYRKAVNDDSFRKEFESELSEYIEKVKSDIESLDDLNTNLIKTDLCYWRKHSDLNGILQDLYYDKGGEGEFNCKYLLLSKNDVINIIKQHKEHINSVNEISHTPGFFWGHTTMEQWEESLIDFENVLKETDWNNETVYYSCWW